MIIHIAPWSNDPPREPGLLLFSLSFLPPSAPPSRCSSSVLSYGATSLYKTVRLGGGVVLLSCNTGSPLFIREKGRISLSGKRVCAKEEARKRRQHHTAPPETRWGSALLMDAPTLMPLLFMPAPARGVLRGERGRGAHLLRKIFLAVCTLLCGAEIADINVGNKPEPARRRSLSIVVARKKSSSTIVRSQLPSPDTLRTCVRSARLPLMDL